MTFEDASGFQGQADVLYSPASETELSELLSKAQRSRTPVTIIGAGSGVTGGGVPQGGWAVSLANFRKLEIGEGTARVGAGVLLQELHAAARLRRQFYAPDPTHTAAAMGGTIANNASGSRSFRYGSTRRHLLSLRVVLPTGEVREFHRGEAIDFPVPALRQPATTKHQAGYQLQPGMDWIDLFCGSEGTLGIVTEATVRLLPAPGPLLTGVVFFPSEGLLLEAVEQWRSIENLRMLEFLDAASLRLLGHSGGGALLVEQEFPQEAEADADLWLDRLEAAGALTDDSWFALTEADRERFRRFRHSLPEKVNETVRSRGYLKVNTDYAVPLAQNAAMMAMYRRALGSFSGESVLFGHIGDAHLHANLLPGSDVQWETAMRIVLDLAREAVELGGTVGAEHGLGKRKARLLELLYTQSEIEAMRAVKRRLDPAWILGQGTLFPEPFPGNS